MEEWLSGLKHRLGKAARVTPPQVRILFLPPYRGVVQRLVLRSPKPSMRVRILPPLPANETSSVLLSSCGGASRFGVNRLLARRIDTALKTKTLRSGKWLKLSRQINNGVPASCKRRNRHSAHFLSEQYTNHFKWSTVNWFCRSFIMMRSRLVRRCCDWCIFEIKSLKLFQFCYTIFI